MPLNLKADPILSCFPAALDEIYGDRLERVILPNALLLVPTLLFPRSFIRKE
jgi:hypothetical protein